MLESKRTNLLGQVDGMAARGRAECTTTTTELRSLAIAMTSAAALLLLELLAGANAFRTIRRNELTTAFGGGIVSF